jgi:hypothetical protein
VKADLSSRLDLAALLSSKSCPLQFSFSSFIREALGSRTTRKIKACVVCNNSFAINRYGYGCPKRFEKMKD